MITGSRYRLTAEINRQSDLARDIARAQIQVSTQKRILNPSDDPIGAARATEIDRTQANEAAWMRNVETSAALASRADTTLEAVEKVMVRAQELMVRGASETLSDENRATIAAELRGIAEDIASLIDTRDSRGALLFSRGDALEIPVNSGLRIAPVASRAEIFEGIATPGGAADLVDIVNAAATAVSETDPDVRAPAVAASIDAVNAGSAHITAARGEQGVRAARIDNVRERLTESELQLTELKAEIESVDLPKVIAELEAKTLTLKAAQAVFARVNQNSLFDLLR
jgi:flagellar hook-associated protein 3 FlgL